MSACFGEWLAHQAGEGRDIMSGDAPKYRPLRRHGYCPAEELADEYATDLPAEEAKAEGENESCK